MKTKVIAYYLPQFHTIKENNEWWGEGFTEWTHVKGGKPLFDSHYQPITPLNDNYYNLMDKETIIWQTSLLDKYGIYGLAYYHYWFKGKMLLERPAENLLKWKDINQRFFFFWANHSWYKSENGTKTLLIEQSYGSKVEWKKHYFYMKQFFDDKRYIKIANKPVLGIFKPKDIPNFDDMVDFWNKLAIKDGYAGIYIIESINFVYRKPQSKKTNAVVLRQPSLAMNRYGVPSNKYIIFLHSRLQATCQKLFIRKKLRIYDYKKIMSLEANEKTSHYKKSIKKVFYGVSTGWDNTARHGKYGQVMVNSTPENFKNGFEKLYKKSCDEENEFIFINAWNEWAEGMVLEPDSRNSYGFLEAIRDTIS